MATGDHAPLIALLTDFGTHDPYVAIMKGVMAVHCPGAQFIDITHDVTPQQIKQAAYLLDSSYRYFPSHTVFLVVVDPGVGTARRPIAIRTPAGTFVGPDNGVLSPALEVDSGLDAIAISVAGERAISHTFHGRDVFAPTAAHLAYGRPLRDLGVPVDRASLQTASIYPMHRVEPSGIAGEVIHIDHFGNLITSIGPLTWDRDGLFLHWPEGNPAWIDPLHVHVTVAGLTLRRILRTYAEGPLRMPVALISSDRRLEIAVNHGNAAHAVGAAVGDKVQFDMPTLIFP